jgi:hypothetical protein
MSGIVDAGEFADLTILGKVNINIKINHIAVVH